MRQAISAIVLHYLSSTAEYRITHLYHLCVARTPSPFLWQLRMRYGKKGLENPWDGTGELLHERIFWHSASFTYAETTSGRARTGATLHLGPIRLHLENWGCRALKSLARCQRFGEPCRFLSSCKWGLSYISWTWMVLNSINSISVIDVNMLTFKQIKEW